MQKRQQETAEGGHTPPRAESVLRGKLQKGEGRKEGRRKKKEKSKNLLCALVFQSFTTNSLTPSPLSGRHLASTPTPPPLPCPHPSHPVPSSCLTHPLPHTPSPLRPHSVWVTPGRVCASDPGTAPPQTLPAPSRRPSRAQA